MSFWKSRRPIPPAIPLVYEPAITKRKVVMTNVVALPNGEMATHVATDYVRPDFLEAYVADAETRWQLVEVIDIADAGPGGYGGPTTIPEHLKDK